jgi:hypothetical protein
LLAFINVSLSVSELPDLGSFLPMALCGKSALLDSPDAIPVKECPSPEREEIGLEVRAYHALKYTAKGPCSCISARPKGTPWRPVIGVSCRLGIRPDRKRRGDLLSLAALLRRPERVALKRLRPMPKNDLPDAGGRTGRKG